MAQRATPAGDATRNGTTGRVDVVALVTSAGGLEALSAVLRGLPEDFPAAVVVGQHLSGQGSTLVEILGRRTRLPVEWARDGSALRAGHVTVCPPRTRRSEEHTSELQSRQYLVCRLLLEKKK